MQSTNSARLSEQLKRLGELEMDSGRKHAAKEAAELQLEQYEEQAKKTIARLEHELAELQNQLAAEKANNETLRTADGVNASKLRQEARQLQEKIAELNACETEKGQMVEEIARLEKELEELRKRLAELLQELGELKSNRQTRAPPSPPVEEAEMVEERQQLVYDEAASMLEGLRRVSLFNLLYSVSFSKVRDQRQWKALTLSALCEAVRPLPVNRKRDSMYYAKKRSARCSSTWRRRRTITNFRDLAGLRANRERWSSSLAGTKRKTCGFGRRARWPRSLASSKAPTLINSINSAVYKPRWS